MDAAAHDTADRASIANLVDSDPVATASDAGPATARSDSQARSGDLLASPPAMASPSFQPNYRGENASLKNQLVKNFSLKMATW